MAKVLKLSDGKYVLLDDDVFEIIKQSKEAWYSHKGRFTYYAVCTHRSNGKRTTVQMHRVIMGVEDSNLQVDHKNGNGLDNRRINLRICNNSSNQGNARKRKNAVTSNYKGVSSYQTTKTTMWRSQIQYNGKKMQIGSFYTELEAAKAYNEKALELFGEFALVNKIGS